MTVSRRPLVAGNWKMNLDHLEAIALVQRLAFSLTADDTAAVDVVVLPPFTDLRSVQTLVDGERLTLGYGAQDLSPHASGAYTGDVSGPMLARLGCSWVVVGHSERRQLHGETDEVVAAKVRAAFAVGVTPMVCVGELLEVRDAGGHLEHCLGQLDAALAGLTAEQVGGMAVAYEPIWAIGTGKVASPADAQEMCAALRGRVAETAGREAAAGLRVLYGGSVKPDNAAEVLAGDDVDGALVGGASLVAEDFVTICRAAIPVG